MFFFYNSSFWVWERVRHFWSQICSSLLPGKYKVCQCYSIFREYHLRVIQRLNSFPATQKVTAVWGCKSFCLVSIWARYEVVTKIWNHNPQTPIENQEGGPLETAKGPALDMVKSCSSGLLIPWYPNINLKLNLFRIFLAQIYESPQENIWKPWYILPNSRFPNFSQTSVCERDIYYIWPRRLFPRCLMADSSSRCTNIFKFILICFPNLLCRCIGSSFSMFLLLLISRKTLFKPFSYAPKN